MKNACNKMKELLFFTADVVLYIKKRFLYEDMRGGEENTDKK